MSRKRGVSLLLLLVSLRLIYCLNFRPKAFKVESFHTCPDKPDLQSSMDNVTVSMIQRNLYVLNGNIVVKKNITIPLSLTMDVKRCTLDKMHCEDHDRLTITKLCSKLKDVKQVWGPMVEMIQPPPKCPIKEGLHRMTNATANLSVVSMLPLDGYRWAVRFTVHQEGEPTKAVLCMDVEVSITNQKRRH